MSCWSWADTLHEPLDLGDVDGLAAAVAEQDRRGLDLADHRLGVPLPQRRDPVERSSSSSVSGPEMPNDTTGPNSGSSIEATLTGMPGGAFFCTTNPAERGR
jgi:hypothetical protein